VNPEAEAPAFTAALTLSLTGPYARQGIDAAEGVRLWAEASGVELSLVDDGGSRSAAVEAYAAWLDRRDIDLLLGPYGSGLTRAVVPLVREAAQVLWNHGGSSDDLMQPGVVSVLSPASRYFDGAVDEAVRRGIARMLVVPGAGPFARAVTEGAAARAVERGLDVRSVDGDGLAGEDAADLGVLTAGRFEHDVEVVGRLRGWRHRPALVAAVAAGIPAFEQELGADVAEGVLGPVHWWPGDRTPEIGPSGSEFAQEYRRRTGRQPPYVAAQAAAAGYLALAAHRRGLPPAELIGWSTSTLLGGFALDANWRQVGHRMTTIRWHCGQMIPASPVIRRHDQR
jgi:ABC-type branched-subunit amino acid transport system substrate-binding protein